MSTPPDDDRVEALRRFLVGLARGDDANRLVVDIADLHEPHNTFPGEVLMELAADALDIAGTERESPFAHRELLSTHLPEVEFRGKEHRRGFFCRPRVAGSTGSCSIPMAAVTDKPDAVRLHRYVVTAPSWSAPCLAASRGSNPT